MIKALSISLSILVMMASAGALAKNSKPQYERLENCGEVTHVTGTTCKDLEVTFSFEKCAAPPAQSVKVKDVYCSDDKATATYHAPPYKFDGHLKLVKAGAHTPSKTTGSTWDAAAASAKGAWERNGKRLRQWKEHSATVASIPAPTHKISASPAVHVAPPVAKLDPAPAAVARTPAQEVAAELANVKVSGFLNPAYHWNDKPMDKGFALNDSAFYISYKKGKTGAFLDIPIISGTNLTASNLSAAPTTEDQEGTLALAKQRAQAYVTYAPIEWLTLTMGQFDTLYGYELNDAKDRFFARTGLVYNRALNLTHTGFMAMATMDSFTFKLLGANPNNRSNLQGSNDTELGAQVSYALNETTYFTAGYLTYRDATANKDNTMTDLIAGTRVGDVKMDFEFNLRGLTDGSGEAKWYLGHFLYDGFETHKIALRVEYGDSVDAATTSMFQHSLGYRFVESDSFWIQLEVQALTSNLPGDNSSTKAGSTVSVLHTF